MLPRNWLSKLRLEERGAPEFLQPTDDLTGVPHAALIRQSFEELGLAAIHCVSAVPSIAFLVLDNFDQDRVNHVHKALWNQGLASLLFVINHDTLRVYSLAQIPSRDGDLTDKLVQVLTLANDGLELRNLVLGVESGRYISENENKFNSNNRVDQVLLSNLESTVRSLVQHNMKLDAAQALLVQIMFIAYLEDREIINSRYFQKATNNTQIDSLKTLLTHRSPSMFSDLFSQLRAHFNGDLFIAPCSFDTTQNIEILNEQHIKILSYFRSGNINLESGQYQFWPYNFKFIAIDLISAVYDRFLGFDPIAKRETGAYYTPMFLADLVTEQAWSQLTEKQKKDGQYIDPSCGSGIFLVRLFEKMIDDWKAYHPHQRPRWQTLLSMLERLHGFDIKKESIRVAAFSLYIALLENTKPAEILALMGKGRILPKLCGKTLTVSDFFDIPSTEKYDLVIGNPPWVSRRGKLINAQKWCHEHGYQMPTGEIAWAFAWKSLSHTKQDGIVALLLKATSFLTSQSPTVVNTRKQLMCSTQMIRIINFADARFQLFDGGVAPTALLIYQPLANDQAQNRFDYWVPKADLNLKTKRHITLSSADKAKLPLQMVIDDPLLLKRRMWMQTPDAKLFQYLNNFSKLSEKVVTHQSNGRQIKPNTKRWILGQGFNPANEARLHVAGYKTTESKILTELPHLDMKMYRTLVMPTINNKSWHTSTVYRKNFEAGYHAPHILIPQGTEGSIGRVRASYCTQSLTFRTSIQAISFDEDSSDVAKFLTVLLNSSLVAWHLFHSSSISGMERNKVPLNELLSIPFPSLDELNNSDTSRKAFLKAIEFIDELHAKKDSLLQANITEYYREIDEIAYSYFGLKDSDILLIEDTLSHILPSMQPHSKPKHLPTLWKDTNENDWANYSKWLSYGLTSWLHPPRRAVVELVGVSPDLVVIGVILSDDPDKTYYENRRANNIDEILLKIWNSLPQNMPGNFQLIPDLRIFINDVLYLVKPRKKRFWLGSTALADADAIASDLLSQADKDI